VGLLVCDWIEDPLPGVAEAIRGAAAELVLAEAASFHAQRLAECAEMFAPDWHLRRPPALQPSA
jgi:hypothetical protein